MKRRLIGLVTVILLAAVLTLPAAADVMWEPYGNAFYESHRSECTYVDRSYLANGEEGYVTVKAAPNSLVEVSNVANGSTFRVVHLWQDGDGTQWGMGYYSREIEGWVNLDELALIYDYIAFEEDHSGRFEEYDGSGDDLTRICLYSYPGGVYRYTLEESEDYQSFDEAFEHIYTDENGLRWTFVGYYMGRWYAWGCIDDPMNENLGVESPLSVEQVRSSGGDRVADAPEGASAAETEQETLIPPAEKIPAARTWIVWLVPVVLIVAVALITAVLVRKRKKGAR